MKWSKTGPAANHGQHFTQPPALFRSLIKTLEENGVGRPSTYAPTIETIKKRYVRLASKRFEPAVKLFNKLIVEYFPEHCKMWNLPLKCWTMLRSESGNRLLMNLQTILKRLQSWSRDGKNSNKGWKPAGRLWKVCGSPMVIKDGHFGKFTHVAISLIADTHKPS